MNDLAYLMTTAVLAGFIYFLIWILFRNHRRRKFQVIRRTHALERVRRAEFLASEKSEIRRSMRSHLIEKKLKQSEHKEAVRIAN
jgi:cbb3-type cytochrome oxidase subunit 3